MDAKTQKKEVLAIIGRSLIPSAVYNFDGVAYYDAFAVIKNANEIKELIKKL